MNKFWLIDWLIDCLIDWLIDWLLIDRDFLTSQELRQDWAFEEWINHQQSKKTMADYINRDKRICKYFTAIKLVIWPKTAS